MDKSSQRILLKDGRMLGFAQYGDPKGKPLFYFHGWPVSRFCAKKFDVFGKKLHVRIIAPDRPGYGLSEYKKNRTILDWPDDVVELANYLKIKKFSIVGVSGGGPYSAVCAYKIPERIIRAGIAVGLAPTTVPHILDGMPWMGKMSWGNYPKFRLLRTTAALMQEFMTKMSPSLGLHRFMFGAKSDNKLYADPEIRSAMKADTREAYRSGFRGPALDLELYTKDWGFDLEKIRADVYLFYGSDDTNVPIAMGKYYAAHIPKSKLKVYPGEGHLLFMTHAGEILRTLTT